MKNAVNVIIKVMKPEDATAVAELERNIFPDPWGEAGIRTELEDPLYTGLLAVESPIGKPMEKPIENPVEEPADVHHVGFVLARVVGGEGEILRIGVLDEYRRQGIARTLLRNIFTRCAEAGQGEEQWFLEVRESNEPAIGLYREFGFREVGKRKGYYRDTHEAALLMRWDIWENYKQG